MDRGYKKLKILLSAYSCEPGYSSERGVGWNWALQISKFHEVWVLTRLSNKEAIDEELTKKNFSDLHFAYFDLPKWLRFWKKGERGLYLYYALWQLGSLFVSYKLHKQNKFDLTHYVTFGSILLPTFIFLMPTKFILGPIGGGGKAPLKFLREFSFKGKINELLRHLVQKIYLLNPLLYLETARADKILVRDKETYMMISRFFRKKTVKFLETGMPPELLNFKKTNRSGINQKKGIKIITVGRFIYSKINLITLKVIKRFKEKYELPFEVYIVGDGYEKKNLLRYCIENNISNNINFTGWIDNKKVLELLAESDIYLSTSFKEGGSWALFESIGMEVPIVSLKMGGPDIIICDGGGIKVKVDSPDQVVEDLSEGLLKLAKDSTYRRNLALVAKEHLLNNHTWEKIGQKINKLYEEVV